jgi:hypothetical protein
MLSGFFGAFRKGAAHAKMIHVLSHYYNLDVSHPSTIAITQRIAENFSESLNEHELAIQFLAEFTAYHMLQDHPRAVFEVEKYLRVAGMAYDNEFAKYWPPFEALLRAAHERFGVRPAGL